MFGLASPKKLRELGIVGMNKRNVKYIAQNNPRHLYPLVDDKLKTKELCRQHNLAMPKLLGVCKVQSNVNELEGFLADIPQFVIKPAKGSGGKGILVITGRDGEDFLKPSGAKVTLSEVKRHVSNTLSGLYSLGGKPDVAVIEDLVVFTDDFDGFSFEGVPDIRVIIYKGYPVMAMTRLSTHASDGKANLHQGAVGVGIDIATGHALNAVMNARPIEQHPDTGKALKELKVPLWQELLTLSVQGFDTTGLGYMGADIVLDKNLGPLLLELNARPGLAIQVANGRGLEPRLALAEEQSRLHPDRSAEERVRYSMEVIAPL
ncbi:MAG: alpha-L-glutamate ligase-like protein [Candidatus Pelagadaptatus aseana]|uniref:alpha-L-glutamate ligase-like protein n=1 Tax=Candidatus Pelagadaptatus aseana TaxID=3120508 RepID=UPI0039B18D97